MDNASAIGITTTVPAEIVFAAGRRPVDLNNLFIRDPDPAARVAEAEAAGFPQSLCAWTKGIYATVRRHGLKEVIGVVAGDCSDTVAMLEVLESEGVRVHPFAFPYSREAEDLRREMERLAARLGTTLAAAEAEKARLDHCRVRALDVDTLAAVGGAVPSEILFESLLATSDFEGDPEATAEALRHRLLAFRDLPPPERAPLRLGCAGVPTIYADLWTQLEAGGAQVLFHEVPRQFALPEGIDRGLIEAYLDYTYPYDIGGRLEDIAAQVRERRLEGILHYVQSFCHRQIHDRLLRERLDIPVLTLEGDRPGPVDERTRTRIEAFLEQIAARRV